MLYLLGNYERNITYRVRIIAIFKTFHSWSIYTVDTKDTQQRKIDQLRTPALLTLSRNAADNWRRFRQEFDLFLKASGAVQEEDEQKDPGLRRRLLENSDLNLEKSISICQASELTQARLQVLEGNQNYATVDSLRQPHSKKSLQQHNRMEASGLNCTRTCQSESAKNYVNDCSSCGVEQQFRQCPAFGNTCHICKKQAHFAKVCRQAQTVAIKNKVSVFCKVEKASELLCTEKTLTLAQWRPFMW
ncbi:uncharacterized protein LOC128350506 [Hemicordylus capensis]|uniref:uncharacterized protein LOC128350506 n=1 Tax=Hemicordylus capensis TaxID=884348 RepID=UPI0023020A61|nr:uncharacterized protein LOC128350506 [Hemicordylus capensis]